MSAVTTGHYHKTSDCAGLDCFHHFIGKSKDLSVGESTGKCAIFQFFRRRTRFCQFDDSRKIFGFAIFELQLKTLSLEGGQVAVDGSVTALIYEEPRTGGWRQRLFG